MFININIETNKSIDKDKVNKCISMFIRCIGFLGSIKTHQILVVSDGKAKVNKKALHM